MRNYWELSYELVNGENTKVINLYLLSMKDSGISKCSVYNNQKVLGRFFKYKDELYSSITSDDIHKWFKVNPTWSKRTREGYMSILRSFYSFCFHEGYIENPPLRKRRWRPVSEKYWEVQQPLACKQNEEVINEYLLEMKNGDRTQKQLIGIRGDLQSFFREKKDYLSSVTSEDVLQWFEDHIDSREESTVKSKLVTIRSFYRFCIKKGYMQDSPIPYLWNRRFSKNIYWEVNGFIRNKRNRDMINEFLMCHKIANNSEATIRSYRNLLQRFFHNKEEAFNELHSEDIQQWFLERRGKWKETSFAYYLGVLFTFYKFCVEEEYMEKTPIKSRWFPRLPKSVPKYLEREEVAKIRLHTEKETIRNRTIVEFFLASGCRIGEVHRLNKVDVDLVNRSARVIGKGKKIRTVHFTEKCALLLEQYLKTRADDNPALFTSQFDTRLGSSRIHEIIKEIGLLADTNTSLHAHRFRHTFATELFVKGADLTFIAEELGHENISTTQIYAQLPHHELISKYRKYMG